LGVGTRQVDRDRRRDGRRRCDFIDDERGRGRHCWGVDGVRGGGYHGLSRRRGQLAVETCQVDGDRRRDGRRIDDERDGRGRDDGGDNYGLGGGGNELCPCSPSLELLLATSKYSVSKSSLPETKE
jgi:hypothetical protein